MTQNTVWDSLYSLLVRIHSDEIGMLQDIDIDLVYELSEEDCMTFMLKLQSEIKQLKCFSPYSFKSEPIKVMES